ncbi:MAG: hypothetical protein BGN98_13915 [Microbacterium sp. 69-7]|uniref:hypothetical protein n=1 Tax=Microbacterium sp. 69-7 TaxID=1895784 RepID=UPI00095B36A9|nr:hypothetical protein [Microbacterium sp. 69-7]OJU44476.1 MAG: hypothetical protein BGN98_13915 [Microbacterium sp. 69-7]
MILGEDNRKPYSQMDVLISLAYERYKNETCPEHGGPIWLCRNADPTLQVKVVDTPACYATQEVRLYEEKHKDDDEKVSVKAEFYSRIDLPLHKYRDRYYADLMAPDEEDEPADAAD